LRQAKHVTSKNDTLEVCSKCGGFGYICWVNNILGKKS